jgi:hypothetical protein
MSEWTLGERSPEIERHLQTCGECHQEVERLHDGLVAFKHAVHAWSDQHDSTRPVKAAVAPARPLSWKWAAASAMVLSAVLLPLYVEIKQAEREADSARDSLLLTQVNARLARTVPQSMEALMNLMNEGKDDSQ